MQHVDHVLEGHCVDGAIGTAPIVRRDFHHTATEDANNGMRDTEPSICLPNPAFRDVQQHGWKEREGKENDRRAGSSDSGRVSG
jgi:hypothetical protein